MRQPTLHHHINFEHLVLNQMLFFALRASIRSSKPKDRSVMPMIVKIIRLSAHSQKGVPIERKIESKHNQRR